MVSQVAALTKCPASPGTLAEELWGWSETGSPLWGPASLQAMKGLLVTDTERQPKKCGWGPWSESGHALTSQASLSLSAEST